MEYSRPRFREDKAVAVAYRLLELHGRAMTYLKLLKLMYIIDRTAFLAWGRLVTYDSYFSMPKGPVPSITYNRIQQEIWPDDVETLWDEHINRSGKWRLEPSDNVPNAGCLSDAEIELVGEVHAKFGSMHRMDLVKYTHKFPEWQNPHGSSYPIPLRDILEKNDTPSDEADAILDELDTLAQMEALIA